MDERVKIVLSPLLAEIRRDLWFFAPLGVIVGLMMIWQSRLRELGIAAGKSWPDALFVDFVPFNAFGCIFLGLLAVGSFATILEVHGYQWQRLEAAVAHLKARLAQLGSSIISFTLGLGSVSLLHSVLTVTPAGALLVLRILQQACLLVVGFMTVTIFTSRSKPFDRLWPSILMLLIALTMIALLIVRGL